MFVLNEVKRILTDYISRGVSNFILYPFGNNGIWVKNILIDCFNVNPVYIVDNKYCQFNPNIISFNELITKDIDQCMIILTIEDEDLNFMMEEMCLEYFDRNQIINLKQRLSKGTQILTWRYLEKDYCEDVFDASNFLKYIDKTDNIPKDNKIKVRILHNGARVWNAFETVCAAFKDDPRFSVLLILYSVANDFSQMVEQVNSGGYNYVDILKYNSQMDNPDIFIYASPFMKSFVKPLCMAAKISFIIPITLMLYSPNKTSRFESAKITVQEMEEAGVNYCLAERCLYDSLPKNSNVSILEFGNPKIDVLYRLSVKKKVSEKFQKLNNKTIVLFTTAHGNRNGRFMDGITFDLYARQVFEFARQNSQIGLIFRPHPLFIVELIGSNYWRAEDVSAFKEYINSIENMIWDDNDTYEEALMLTDAIITDGYCGMVVSTLPLLKPICALYRDYDIQSMCPEVDNVLYVARKGEELDDFLENVVVRGADTMYEIRKSACNKFIKYFDGKNGKRIKDFIALKYLEL